jgi:hypothetical protein
LNTPPNEEHLAIEALLRGATQLLPNEGLAGWVIVESHKRQTLTKVVRMTLNGGSRLAFERLGKPFKFWMHVNSFDPNRSGLPVPILRTKGQTKSGKSAVGLNPGGHSNVFGFFGSPNELWELNFKANPPSWKILMALS